MRSSPSPHHEFVTTGIGHADRSLHATLRSWVRRQVSGAYDQVGPPSSRFVDFRPTDAKIPYPSVCCCAKDVARGQLWMMLSFIKGKGRVRSALPNPASPHVLKT